MKETIPQNNMRARTDEVSMKEIVPLSLPKGWEQPICELCTQTSRCICGKCGTVSYCSLKHARMDKLHPKLCDYIKAVHVNSLKYARHQEERLRKQKQQMILKEALMQRAQEVSINMMGENDKEQAYLAANFRVKTTIDMYGSGHPATWTGLILLASTYINLRDYSKAGSCLSKIQASLLDQDIKCPLELGAELSRVYGLIAEGQGCLDDALTEFSEEVYSNSKVHGTHGWKTAGSYWRLGRTFLHKGLHDVADSMYRQTVDIWLTYLRDKLLTNDEEKDVAAGVGGLFQKVKVEILDGEAKVQCSEALTDIHDTRNRLDKFLGRPYDVLMTCFALGMLKYATEKYMEALYLAERTIKLCEKVELQARDKKELTTFFKMIRRKLPNQVTAVLKHFTQMQWP